MTINLILVPTDFSAPSRDALTYAMGLATAFKASIHLLHVFQDPLSQPWGLEGYGPLPVEDPVQYRSHDYDDPRNRSKRLGSVF